MARELRIEQPFDLALSLTMGQAFRWRPLGEGWFSGVIGGSLVHIRQTGAGVEYRVGGPHGERTADEIDDELLLRYFREDDDVSRIYSDLAGGDANLSRLVKEYGGMRLLRQDPWECTVAYLCSANNNITQISRLVERIATEFGDTVAIGGEVRSVFPAPPLLASDGAEELLGRMRLGLKRAPNIVAAARLLCSGELDLRALRGEPYIVAKREIGKCAGVGNKIADCIALFSLDKLEAFPVDVHIGRALSGWVNCPFPQSARYLSDTQYAAVVSWAQDTFGPYAGYAGQFMFCDQPK